MYFIKIDRNSIKLNPRGGETSTVFRTHKTVSFDLNTLPDFFINGDNVIIESAKHSLIEGDRYTGTIYDDETINKCIELKLNIEISMKRDRYTHEPLPTWLYKYLPTKVKCCSCGVEFNHNELLPDVTDDDEYSSDKVCPKCNEFDCCEVEYENINSIK